MRNGGAGGIRTLDTALQPYNGLANRRLQPLGHSTIPSFSLRDAAEGIHYFPLAGGCLSAPSQKGALLPQIGLRLKRAALSPKTVPCRDAMS